MVFKVGNWFSIIKDMEITFKIFTVTLRIGVLLALIIDFIAGFWFWHKGTFNA